MKLAKPHLDVGLYVRNTDTALAFWQQRVGAVFDHTLAIRKGVRQHRHDLFGSVLKINNSREPLPENPPTGYRELLVARSGIDGPVALHDPEGNRVMLVPPGHLGVDKIGMRLAVGDLTAHRDFYGRTLDSRKNALTVRAPDSAPETA